MTTVVQKCAHCRAIKPLTDFRLVKQGYSRWCDVCLTRHKKHNDAARAKRKAMRPLPPPKLPADQKRCSTCDIIKPASREYFYVHKGGLSSQCKACRAAYYQANKERISARMKARKQTPVARARAAAYYRDNKERILSRVKAYQEDPAVRARRTELKRQKRATRIHDTQKENA